MLLFSNGECDSKRATKQGRGLNIITLDLHVAKPERQYAISSCHWKIQLNRLYIPYFRRNAEECLSATDRVQRASTVHADSTLGDIFLSWISLSSDLQWHMGADY